MKKILILFVLCLGLMSFTDSSAAEIANENVISNNFVDNEISVEHLISYSVDVENEDVLYSCRATITYNGTPVASTTGFGNTAAEACDQARALARLWIAAQ
jgi:hypothetical protein